LHPRPASRPDVRCVPVPPHFTVSKISGFRPCAPQQIDLDCSPTRKFASTAATFLPQASAPAWRRSRFKSWWTSINARQGQILGARRRRRWPRIPSSNRRRARPPHRPARTRSRPSCSGIAGRPVSGFAWPTGFVSCVARPPGVIVHAPGKPERSNPRDRVGHKSRVRGRVEFFVNNFNALARYTRSIRRAHWESPPCRSIANFGRPGPAAVRQDRGTLPLAPAGGLILGPAFPRTPRLPDPWRALFPGPAARSVGPLRSRSGRPEFVQPPVRRVRQRRPG